MDAIYKNDTGLYDDGWGGETYASPIRGRRYQW